MELKRYEPMFGLTRPNWLARFLDRDLFAPLFGEPEAWVTTSFVPAVDIREKADAYIIEAEVPGIKKEDIKIDLKDGVLTISGERKYEHTEKEPNFTRVERSYGAFCRSFDLPDHVLDDKIDAAIKDGILTVTLPKGEKAKPKTSRIVAMSFCEPRSCRLQLSS